LAKLLTAESLKSVFDTIAVVLLFLTFIAGVGALIAGNIVNNRQAEQLRQFEKDIVDAKERTSANEKEAAELRKQAEDERMARIQLAASISWRTPDRGLIPKLAPALQPFARQRFAFVTDVSDPERLAVLSWLGALLGAAKWGIETAPVSSIGPETRFMATNVVLWLSPTAPKKVSDAAHVLVSVLEDAGLESAVLQSGWGPQPDAAPPELIRVVIFKKGPRMVVTGNTTTFEASPTNTILFEQGPPH
jgi:hypothetical protein